MQSTGKLVLVLEDEPFLHKINPCTCYADYISTLWSLIGEPPLVTYFVNNDETWCFPPSSGNLPDEMNHFVLRGDRVNRRRGRLSAPAYMFALAEEEPILACFHNISHTQGPQLHAFMAVAERYDLQTDIHKCTCKQGADYRAKERELAEYANKMKYKGHEARYEQRRLEQFSPKHNHIEEGLKREFEREQGRRQGTPASHGYDRRVNSTRRYRNR